MIPVVSKVRSSLEPEVGHNSSGIRQIDTQVQTNLQKTTIRLVWINISIKLQFVPPTRAQDVNLQKLVSLINHLKSPGASKNEQFLVNHKHIYSEKQNIFRVAALTFKNLHLT